VDAKQEMVVVAVSDSIYNIGWQSPSETPVLTQVAPIVG
jgi:phenolic acid decarboxylase